MGKPDVPKTGDYQSINIDPRGLPRRSTGILTADSGKHSMRCELRTNHAFLRG
jgi:hypothetical protein